MATKKQNKRDKVRRARRILNNTFHTYFASGKKLYNFGYRNGINKTAFKDSSLEV